MQRLEIPPTPRTTAETTLWATQPQSPPPLPPAARCFEIPHAPPPPTPTLTTLQPARPSTFHTCSWFLPLLHGFCYSIRQLHQVIPVLLTQLPLHLRLHFFPDRLRTPQLFNPGRAQPQPPLSPVFPSPLCNPLIPFFRITASVRVKLVLSIASIS